MYDTFESDINIFNNEIYFLIESRNKPQILRQIKDKHLLEKENIIPVNTKKNDLIIWNAVLTREITKNGITKRYLHTVYNKFYKAILSAVKLDELQELELHIVSEYLDMLINDVEVTSNLVINRILQYLHINIESHISLESLSNDLNISIGYACECFKKHMNISIMHYAKKIKIERGKTLLLSTDKSILDIGLLLGFYDQSHFSKTFKSITGVSPTEFRNKNFS